MRQDTAEEIVANAGYFASRLERELARITPEMLENPALARQVGDVLTAIERLHDHELFETATA